MAHGPGTTNDERPAEWIDPMLAAPGGIAGALTPEEWLFERKLDGLRTIVVRDGPRIELWSRNHLSCNARFPSLVDAVGALPARSFVLDAEVVAFDGERTSFGLLQGREPGVVPILFAFDLMALLGRDTTGLDVPARRDLLRRLIGPLDGSSIRVAEFLDGEPSALLSAACEQGWEGLVAKRRSSRYQPGRSPDWRKLKCRADQELVVGGWTEPTGTRAGLGALLVGVYDDSGLRFAGRVGTGFDGRTLLSVRSRLGPLEVSESPFVDTVRVPRSHWARPELVATVAFTEWTRDGRLRQPSFEGLREDKDPATVRRDPPPT